MRTIACVLKTGVWRNRHMRVEYGPDHVRWLRDQFPRYVGTAYRFVCLSDIPIAGVDVIPLRDDLPGWWSKLELFRELEDAFYVDLDTVIVGDITRMVKHKHKFTVLRNLSSKQDGRIGSGVSGVAGRLLAPVPHIHGGPAAAYGRVRDAGQVGRQGFIQHVQRSMAAGIISRTCGRASSRSRRTCATETGKGLPNRVFPRRASALGIGQVGVPELKHGH